MPDVQTTVIGPGARFKGELQLEGEARIMGGFEGHITATGTVHIGTTSDCNATVEADTINVDGAVRGDLIARQRLQLTNNARVQGDVNAAALIVAEGATFVGRCTVGPDAVTMVSARPAAVGTPATAPTAAETKPTTGRRAVPDWARDTTEPRAEARPPRAATNGHPAPAETN